MNKRMGYNTSVVVITHNRTHFLKQFVNSLDDLSFGGHLIIAESSDIHFLERSEAFFSEREFAYRITHLHVPKKTGQSISHSMNDSFKAGIAAIDTEFALLSCDDDIPLPSGLEQCESFLKTNKNYNGVIGDIVWIDNKECYQPMHNNILSSIWKFDNLKGRRRGKVPTFSIESDTASERFNEYIDKMFHTMFVMVRKETLNYIIPENHHSIQFPHFCADYNWMFTIAISGKIKHLNSPYIIRQFHGKNLSIKDENHPFPKYSDAMLTDTWPNDARLFVNNMTQNISRIDRTLPEQTEKQVKRFFRKLTMWRLDREARIQEKSFKDKLKSLWFYLQYKLVFFSQCRDYTKAKLVVTKHIERE